MYTPEHLIKHPNPLLERYRKRYALSKDLELIPYKRLPLNSWVNLATLMLIIWVGLLLTRGLMIGWSLIGLMLILQTCYSLYADMRICHDTVGQWHEHIQQGPLDVLRLLPGGEERLAATIVATSQIRHWPVIVTESWLRLLTLALLCLIIVPASLAGLMLLPGYLGLFNYRGYYQPPALPIYCLLLSHIPLTFAVLVSFLRGPVWRLRVATNVGSLAALVWNDTATAAIVSLAALLGLRLAHGMAFVLMVYVDLMLLSDSRWHGVGAIMILISALAWNRVLNSVLSALEQWSRRQLLARLCRGE